MLVVLLPYYCIAWVIFWFSAVSLVFLCFFLRAEDELLLEDALFPPSGIVWNDFSPIMTGEKRDFGPIGGHMTAFLKSLELPLLGEVSKYC